ncbi:SlyX family protein [Ideonella sp.]|uniref:SlyX family protein n=1 Tax=Ideonella sp. TaxID=1929293 RepID=UPI0035B13B6F
MSALHDDPSSTEIDRRLMELEIKASFSEDLIDHLNEAIVRQQQQIELLMRELRQLRDQLPNDSAGTPRTLRDELPPHY